MNSENLRRLHEPSASKLWDIQLIAMLSEGIAMFPGSCHVIGSGLAIPIKSKSSVIPYVIYYEYI